MLSAVIWRSSSHAVWYVPLQVMYVAHYVTAADTPGQHGFATPASHPQIYWNANTDKAAHTTTWVLAITQLLNSKHVRTEEW